MNKKTCNKCDRSLPEDVFGPHKYYCRKCRAQTQKNWRHKNHERDKEIKDLYNNDTVVGLPKLFGEEVLIG